MSIKINSTTVSHDFTGTISLGKATKLYVSANDEYDYSLYGTILRKEKLTTVTVPSGDKSLNENKSIEGYLSEKVTARSILTKELDRLEGVRADVIAGKYDYGVSSELIDVLNFLSTNAIKPLPSMIVGGKLGYEDLIKNNEDAEPFKDSWEKWSHVFPGLKRYEEPVDDESIPGDSINTEENPAML